MLKLSMALTMNYTYRIYPSVAQQKLMLSWLETCRRLYNRCLRDLKDWMNSRKCRVDRCSIDREYIMSPDIPFPGYIEQKRQLTQWKKRCDPAPFRFGSCSTWGDPKTALHSPPAGAKERAPRETEPELKAVHSQVTQDVVKRLHNSWEAFKQRGHGFPRFKKYGRLQSFLFPQFTKHPIIGNQIKLPIIGWVDMNLHREIPTGFKVKGVRVVSRCRGTKWFVVVTIQADVSVPDTPSYGRAIGVDVGLNDFLATSDGFRIPRPFAPACAPARRFFVDLQRELLA